MQKRLLYNMIALGSFFTLITACTWSYLNLNNGGNNGGNNDVILQSAENVIVSGKNVTLQFNTSSRGSGFSLTFLNVGSLTCNDVSIDTTAAYGFIPNSSNFIPAPIESSMPQYYCSKTGTSIVLSGAPPLESEGFRPWVENFNIVVGSSTFVVTVDTQFSPAQLLTRGAQASMNLDSSFEGCGLRGTVLQRVFDCSKNIINYAVYVDATSSASGSSTTNSDGTSAYYTLFTDSNAQDSSLFWFVVDCPSGSGGSVPQQSCAWLTPVVPAGNPALDTANTELFTLDILTGYQKRLLLSGKMDNVGTGYNFANTNGFAEADAYVYTSSSTINPGNGATGSAPTITPASVCTAAAGQNLNDGGTPFNTTDASVRDVLSNSSGASVVWQVPPYSMFNILTGGTPTIGGGVTICPATGGTTGRPLCNTPIGQSNPNFTNSGFSAINVPGFSQTNTNPTNPFPEILWSSSSGGSGGAWAFVALDGGNGGYVDDGDPSSLLGARCVSPAWY